MTLIHARAPWSALLTQLAWVEDTPPLGYLVAKAWSTIALSEAGMRLLSIIFSVAAVAVLMQVGRLLHPRAWWAAGLLAATSYELVYYGQEIRVYALLVLATALTLWGAERFTRQPFSRSTALLVCATVFAAYCHAVGLFVFPMACTYAVLRARVERRKIRALAVASICWAVLASPIFWFGAHWARQHASEGHWWAGPVDLPMATALGRLFIGLTNIRWWSDGGEWGGGMWTGFALERLLIVALVLPAALALIDPGVRRRALAVTGAAAAYVGLMLFSSAVALPNVTERTLLPGWTALLLLPALGAAAPTWVRWRRAAQACVLTVVLVWALSWCWIATSGPLRRPLSAEAMAWLKQRVQPDDLIVSGPYGYEDVIVYRLGEALAGEQLLSEGVPVYTGQPPRHLMIYRHHDPDWSRRLRMRLEEKRRTGSPYSVWVVRYGWAVRGVPDTPEAVISETLRAADRFSSDEPMSTSVIRFLPPEATPSARASSSATD